MSQSQIRLTRTPDVNKVLTFLRGKYQLLSEAEIIKVALSEKYKKEKEDVEEERELRETYKHLLKEGKKLGNKLMREKSLDPKKVTEQEFHDLILDTHKHGA